MAATYEFYGGRTGLFLRLIFIIGHQALDQTGNTCSLQGSEDVCKSWGVASGWSAFYVKIAASQEL